MKLICDYCKQPFERKKVKKAAYHFCCVEHHQLWRKQNAKKKVKCLNCGKLTDNPKFCSSKCAATYNNKKHPKRERKLHFCKTCGIEVPYKRKYCTKCHPQYRNWSKLTVRDILYNTNVAANKYTRIRDNGKKVYKDSDKPKQCVNCGYNTHYEICHIKPIHSFNLDTPISVVNHVDNLIALCPNCHWEFDHGMLTL